MSKRGPKVLLEQMLEAATMARSFIEGMDKSTFMEDARTQHAVSMALLTIGEMAGRLAQKHPAFLEEHPEIPWSMIRAMRNRIAHGYFELDFDVVWETVHRDASELAHRLPEIIAAASNEAPRSPSLAND